MTCDRAMEAYLRLDRDEAPSRELAAHIESCPLCGREVWGLTASLQAFPPTADCRPGRDLAGPVMARIADLKAAPGPDALSWRSREERPLLSLYNWIGTGLMILAGMILIPYSTIPPLLNRIVGPDWELSLHLVLGLVITIYTTLFIGSHLTDLRRLLKMR